MCTPFPDAQVSIEDIFAEGDKAAVRWTFHGKRNGEFARIAAAGKEVKGTGISVVRMEGNKIAEGCDGYDALGMLRQLGVLP